ncbi:hypothetical protein [Actinokineospora enzanensis]|uniref:hypothetical protein n=1 Tax=Actinokineospora enzanensis TaxID=155975 RepID=UPI0012EB1C96|nr:hypothetical protein [Actinokineospora enzanensis]
MGLSARRIFWSKKCDRKIAMSSQTSTRRASRGRPTKPGRGPHKIGTTVDDLLKQAAQARIAELGLKSEADYVHWLLTKDLNANTTEVAA